MAEVLGGLSLPPRSKKPRKHGLTSIIDYGPDERGWTGERGIADLLDCAAPYIDFAKIYALNALLLPHPVLARIVARYRDAEISCYAGGILFEYAYRRNEIDGFINHARGLGFDAVELSENYVELTDNERRQLIDRFQRSGLSVIYEFGRKNPTELMSLEQLAARVGAAMEQGVEHIILEQSEITHTAGRDPMLLQSITSQPWFANVLIETDPFQFPAHCVSLIRDFGKDVNLANVAPGQALRLEGFRQGIGRAVDYSILRD